MKESFTYAVVRLYGYNEPVLVEDLLNLYPDISRQAVYKKLDTAIEEGKVVRYDRGVYYVPEQPVDPAINLGRDDDRPRTEEEWITLGVNEDFPVHVAKRRWIEDYSGNVFGHVAGSSLVYECGLLEARPTTLEITTNKESSRVREVGAFGPWKKILLRRSRCEVTSTNAGVQKFLDLITSVQLEKLDEEKFQIVARMAKSLDRDTIYDCLEFYPGKTSKRLAFCERKRIFR